MEYAIETSNLVKHYREFTALNNLSMRIPTGSVYGLLGTNGSGKTTTLRIITGLVKPDKGSISIFGKNIDKNRSNIISTIGALIETPGAYENLSAFENLEITAMMFSIERQKIHEVLELVGLSNTKYRKVGTFSLGMKQRLGIANSLIHSPKILILDEPTNGLDPIGINDIRILIQNLSRFFGITVLISSHLLSEVQQIADYVGIIDRGKLLVETNVASIRAHEQSYLIIETNKTNETIEIIKSMGFIFEVKKNVIKVFCRKIENGNINMQLVNKKILVHNLESVPKTLEEIFLSATVNNTSCTEVIS